jgi:hypothetical protein
MEDRRARHLLALLKRNAEASALEATMALQVGEERAQAMGSAAAVIQSHERARQARQLARSLARAARVEAALTHSDEVLTARTAETSRSEVTDVTSGTQTQSVLALGEAVASAPSPGKSEQAQEKQILAGLKALFANTDGVSEVVQAQALAAIAALTEEKKQVKAAKASVAGEAEGAVGDETTSEARTDDDVETVVTMEATPREAEVRAEDDAANWIEEFAAVPTDDSTPDGEAVTVPYYYNTVTGESQWELPQSWCEPQQGRDWTEEEPASAQGWIEADSKGQIYYYNTITGESAWEKPDGWDASTKQPRWSLVATTPTPRSKLANSTPTPPSAKLPKSPLATRSPASSVASKLKRKSSTSKLNVALQSTLEAAGAVEAAATAEAAAAAAAEAAAEAVAAETVPEVAETVRPDPVVHSFAALAPSSLTDPHPPPGAAYLWCEVTPEDASSFREQAAHPERLENRVQGISHGLAAATRGKGTGYIGLASITTASETLLMAGWWHAVPKAPKGKVGSLSAAMNVPDVVDVGHLRDRSIVDAIVRSRSVVLIDQARALLMGPGEHEASG